MNFIVKLSNGDRFVVTPDEAKAIVNSDKGDTITLKEKGIMIAKSYVVSVYPESKADDIEDRKEQKTGVLHDGTLVERHYNGRWVVQGKTVPDDKGNYMPIEIDPDYYPEIKCLNVFSEKEFKKIAHLNPSERLQLMIRDVKPRKLNAEAKSLKDLINKKII